jgi:fructosamine-3-kinase
MALWDAVAADLETATGVRAPLNRQGAVSGGCINQAQRIEYGGTLYFVKLNTAGQVGMFAAEAEGLNAMRRCDALRIPAPVCRGADRQSSWLVMENLELGGRGNAAALGEGLAAMHRITQDTFGWHRDNTIGSTPQVNSPDENWVDFYRQQRLQFQLELAERNGCGRQLSSRGERLLAGFHVLFSDYSPQPSLLHGDLWSGNHAWTRAGEPAIFDPAVYFGDREADLAMTELFGGFSGGFYDAYENAWPIDPGYRVRKTLYNLYHILNHFNLFGGGYASQAQGMVDRLLAEIG